MNRAWNIIWRVAAALALPGLVIGAIGFMLGGPQTVLWTRQGPKVVPVHDTHIDEQSLDAFTAIDVATATMSVKIIAGDHFGLKVDAANTYCVVNWSDSDGTLKLTEKAPDNGFGIGFISASQHGTAVVTVPAAASPVKMSSTTGNVTISAPAGVVNAETSTGSIFVTGASDSLTLQTVTGSLQVDGPVTGAVSARSGTGNVDINGPSSSVQVDTSTGDVAISGQTKSIHVQTSTGDTTISQSTSWATTSYQLATSTGRYVLKGAGAPQPPSNHSPLRGPVEDTPSLDLTVHTSTGNISVNLGD